MVAAKLAVSLDGSEELWSQAAVHQGFVVAAFVGKCLPLHHRVRNLMHTGVRVYLRARMLSAMEEVCGEKYFRMAQVMRR